MIKKNFFLYCFIFFPLSFAQTSIFNSLSATQYLPKETLFLIAANNPESLLNRLGREELIQKYQAMYGEIVSEMTAALGHNLLDPNTLRQIGINPSGSCGFALIDPRPEKFALFFTLNEATKAQEMILNFAQRVGLQLQVKRLGDAILLDPGYQNGREFFFILRGNYCFFLGLGSYPYQYTDEPDSKERPEEEVVAMIQKVVQQFAQLAPQESLAHDSVFQKMSTKLGFGQDAGIYVNTARIIELALQDADPIYTGSLEYYEKEVQRIRTELENSKEQPEYLLEKLKRDEQLLKQQQQGVEQAKRRAEQEVQIIQSVLGGLEGLIAAGNLTSNSLQVRSSVAVTEKNRLASFLRNNSNSSLFLETLQNQPIFLLQGTLQPTPLINFINKTFFKTQGIPFDQIKETFKREFQVDLDQELFPLFNGEAGIALTNLSEESSMDFEKMAQNFNVNAMVTLTNSAQAQNVLNRILAHPEMARMFQKNKWNGCTFPTPWKPIYLAIIQDHLVISSEMNFLDQIQQGSKNSFITRLKNPDLQNLLRSPNTAVKGIIDFQMFAFFLLGVNRSSYAMGSLAKPAEASMSTAEAVPYSEAYLQKKQELESLQKQIDELENKKSELYEQTNQIHEEENEHESKAFFQIFEHFGLTAIAVKTEPNELVLEGGHFLDGGDYKTLISQTVEQIISLQSLGNEYQQKTSAIYAQIDAIQQKSGELWNQKYRVQAELDEIRRNDIFEHQQKKEK